MIFINPKLRKIGIGFLDILLLILGFYLSIYISGLNATFFKEYNVDILILIYIIVGSSVFILTGQYNSLTRYLQSRFLYSILLRNFLILIFANLLYFIFFGQTINIRFLLYNSLMFFNIFLYLE